jgi:hypothetical protein
MMLTPSTTAKIKETGAVEVDGPPYLCTDCGKTVQYAHTQDRTLDGWPATVYEECDVGSTDLHWCYESMEYPFWSIDRKEEADRLREHKTPFYIPTTTTTTTGGKGLDG